MADTRTSPAGALYATAAYGTWGLAPLYWKQLTAVPPLELLAFRVLFGMMVFFLLLWLRRGLVQVVEIFKDPTKLRVFALSSVLIGVNWFLYVYAVAAERVLEASLGYFVNPLLNVVLGLLFLGERLRPWQWLAVGLAAAGVLNQTLQAEGFPWIALTLAASFGLYGLVRKLAPAGPLVGSNVETVLLVPMALVYVGWLVHQGECRALAVPPVTQAFVLGTGALTALPLLWFSGAARRLPLTVLGFFQYLAPTGQFLLAVLVFGEPFSAVEVRTFVLIWSGLVVFTLESQIRRRQVRKLPPLVPPTPPVSPAGGGDTR